MDCRSKRMQAAHQSWCGRIEADQTSRRSIMIANPYRGFSPEALRQRLRRLGRDCRSRRIFLGCPPYIPLACNRADYRVASEFQQRTMPHSSSARRLARRMLVVLVEALVRAQPLADELRVRRTAMHSAYNASALNHTSAQPAIDTPRNFQSTAAHSPLP